MESGNDDRFNENRFEDDDQENNENNNEGPNPINFLNQNIRNEFGQNNQDINSNFSGNKFDLGRGDPMKEEQEDINKINPFGNNNQDYFNSEQNAPNKNNPNPLNFQEPTKNPENSNQNDIQNNNEQIINPYPNLNEEKSINSEQIANKISNEDSNKNKNNENVVQGNSEQNKNHFSNISNSISGNINILGNNNEFNPNISLLQQKSLNNNSNNLLNNNINNNNQNNPNFNQISNEINNNNFNNPISNNNLDSFKNNQKGNNQISNINNEGNNSGIKAQIDKQNNNNLNNNQMHMINNNQMNMINDNQMNINKNNQMNMINNNQMNINKNNQMNINNNQMNINKNNEMNKNNNQMNMINNQMNINNNQMNRNNNNQMNLNNNNPMNMNVMNNIGMQNQNLNKNININPTTYSFSNYKIAAKTGLKNFGDTSYLNSVLQILGTVRNISSYFLNPKNKATFEENVSLGKKFSFVIHRLFTHLYPLSEKIGEIYKPEALLNVLGELNQVYSTTKSRNPNDLIYFCLDQLHRELNKYNVKFITKMNSSNKDKVIWTKLQDFQKSNNSIISNNFYEFNNFETLELDISGAFNQYKSPFTLGQCLGFQRQKNQDSFCHVCQKYNKIQIYTSIYSSPIYFIFSLNRGNPDQNLLNIKFLIEENIDISQFLENKKSFSKYELIGIVSISMKDNYKYVCFGKSPADKKWYLYNDEKVDNIDIGTVIYCNNNSDYVPCILLYQFQK